MHLSRRGDGRFGLELRPARRTLAHFARLPRQHRYRTKLLVWGAPCRFPPTRQRCRPRLEENRQRYSLQDSQQHFEVHFPLCSLLGWVVSVVAAVTTSNLNEHHLHHPCPSPRLFLAPRVHGHRNCYNADVQPCLTLRTCHIPTSLAGGMLRSPPGWPSVSAVF